MSERKEEEQGKVKEESEEEAKGERSLAAKSFQSLLLIFFSFFLLLLLLFQVNTRDGITITARGLITYQIHDPRAAFMAVQDIHGAVKRGAEVTPMMTSR